MKNAVAFIAEKLGFENVAQKLRDLDNEFGSWKENGNWTKA